MKLDCRAPLKPFLAFEVVICRWLARRHERLIVPHRWFAWRPVKVADGDCRWLEYIERQRIFGWVMFGKDWYMSYRAITSQQTV